MRLDKREGKGSCRACARDRALAPDAAIPAASIILIYTLPLPPAGRYRAGGTGQSLPQ